MDKSLLRTGFINVLILLAAGTVTFLVGKHTGSLAGQVTIWYFGIALAVSLVSWFQLRLHERERVEQLEFDELTRSKNATSLFNTEEVGAFAARQSRAQFEKWFVPIFAVVLVLLQGGAVWWQWQSLEGGATSLNQPLIGAAVFGLVFLPLFMFGKYAAGLARRGGHYLIRPGASYLLLCAYLCLAVSIGIGVHYFFGFKAIDLYLARAFCLLLGLVTVEKAITLVFEIYRPRLKNKEQHLIYESRLVGLLGRPEGLFTTAAQALDYQFGFKVSETWFYQFLQRALAWIILVQVALFLLSTCFVFVEPGEQGLRERFGSPQGAALNPGLHIKLPWPIERIPTFRTSQVQSFIVGVIPEEEEESPADDIIQWTVSHNQEEFKMLVASSEAVQQTADSDATVPVNLLVVSVPIQFEIKNLEQWAYQHINPGEVLKNVATREIVRYLVNVDLIDIMSEGRARAADELKLRIQEHADRVGLGVNILFVGTQDIHPPTEVAESFQNVVGALQQKETTILMAEAYRDQLVPGARALATNLLVEAEVYRLNNVASSAARADRFRNQSKAFRESPEVFTMRNYLNTLSTSITNARTMILSTTNSDEVFEFNFEEKIRPDITDIMVPQE